MSKALKETVYLYVCDGMADCEKTHCKFNGTGDCEHTSDVSHARYQEPRVWDWKSEDKGRITYAERSML